MKWVMRKIPAAIKWGCDGLYSVGKGRGCDVSSRRVKQETCAVPDFMAHGPLSTLMS